MRSSLVIVLAACLSAACSTSKPEAIDPHSNLAAGVLGIERESGSGPYVSGSVESFQLQYEGEAPQVIWSASSGSLNASGTRATWTLPAPGIATMSVTVKEADGIEKTLSWDFQILDANDGLATAREALRAAPMNVTDAGTPDLTGAGCQIAYDSSNNIHLAFTNDTHPSVWYGVWNGSTWNLELVDGMGFNTGGLVSQRVSMVVEPSGKPHLAYFFENASGTMQLWYATKSGSTWTRERVDSTYTPQYAQGTLALNPAQSNQPTIVYTNFVSGTGNRVVVAARTGANTWSNTRLTFSAPSGSQFLRGEAVFDSLGTLYFPYGNYIGTYTPGAATPTEQVSSGGSLDAAWTSLVWSLPDAKLLFRTSNEIVELSVASPFSASTDVRSRVEINGSLEGDLAFVGKPQLLHLHGGNLEFVTPNAQNFFTYTQLATARNSSLPALAVNSSGVASICYQNATGQITFQ